MYFKRIRNGLLAILLIWAAYYVYQTYFNHNGQLRRLFAETEKLVSISKPLESIEGIDRADKILNRFAEQIVVIAPEFDIEKTVANDRELKGIVVNAISQVISLEVQLKIEEMSVIAPQEFKCLIKVSILGKTTDTVAAPEVDPQGRFFDQHFIEVSVYGPPERLRIGRIYHLKNLRERG